MSPISNILHVLASYQEKYGYVYKQPEDEIDREALVQASMQNMELPVEVDM